MTMKSLYIVYKTNFFLWTMSDNKAYLILSYYMPPVETQLNLYIGLYLIGSSAIVYYCITCKSHHPQPLYITV